MIPRGEVGIVVAGIALAAGVVDDDVYAAVIAMVVLTSFIAPFLIARVYGRRSGDRRESEGGGERAAAARSRTDRAAATRVDGLRSATVEPGDRVLPKRGLQTCVEPATAFLKAARVTGSARRGESAQAVCRRPSR